MTRHTCWHLFKITKHQASVRACLELNKRLEKVGKKCTIPTSHEAPSQGARWAQGGGWTHRSWNQQAGGSLVRLRLLLPGHVHLPSGAFLPLSQVIYAAAGGGGDARRRTGTACRGGVVVVVVGEADPQPGMDGEQRSRDGGPAALSPSAAELGTGGSSAARLSSS